MRERTTRVVGMVADVTEHKEAEEVLLRLNEHVAHIGQEASQGRCLGLTIMQRGARLVNGTITIESSLGRNNYSCFMSLSIQRTLLGGQPANRPNSARK